MLRSRKLRKTMRVLAGSRMIAIGARGWRERTVGTGRFLSVGNQGTAAVASHALSTGEEETALVVREIDVAPERVDGPLVSAGTTQARARNQFQALAVKLASAAADEPFRRLLVTSADPGDGRTTVAINLACELAALGTRVLVVDCDAEKPAVLHSLGIEATEPSADEEEIVRVRPYGFDLYSLWNAGSDPRLRARRLGALCERCEPKYDLVVFDAPPLSDVGASALLAGLSDRTLLVVRQGTSADRMAEAIAPLEAEAVLGAVLSRAAH